MTGLADRWIRRTTIGCVALLAIIAGTVSYLHMHLLVELHGQPGWVAALTPLSADGMIVAASTTLLADSRSGRRGGALSWLLLGAGSVASLAANVAVAEPSMTGRIIAAWPSFALIGSYELLMRQIRTAATVASPRRAQVQTSRTREVTVAPAAAARRTRQRSDDSSIQQEALEWAMANRSEDGKLPSGKAIADQFGRHERWGRLVKQHGAGSGVGATAQRTAAWPADTLGRPRRPTFRAHPELRVFATWICMHRTACLFAAADGSVMLQPHFGLALLYILGLSAAEYVLPVDG